MLASPPQCAGISLLNRMKSIIIGLLVVTGCIHYAIGQTDTLLLNGSLGRTGKLDISEHVHFFPDSGGHKSIAEIATQLSLLDLQKMAETKSAASKVWVKLTVHNTGLDTIHALFFTGYHLLEEMYEDNGTTDSLPKVGTPVDLGASHDKFSAVLTIPPGQKTTYWAKTAPFLFFREFTPFLFTKAAYKTFKSFHSDKSMYRFGFRAMVMGLCFFLGLFAFVQGIYTKDTTYGFWGLYLWANFIFFFTSLDYLFKLGIISEITKPWMIVSQYVIQIAYLLFINSFLNIKKYDLPTLKALRFAILVMTAGLFFSFTALFIDNGKMLTYSEQFTFVTDFVILLLFIRIVRVGIPQTRLLIIGSLGVLTMAITAAIVDQFELLQFDIFWLNPVIIFSLGVCFELVFFSLALSKRTYQIKLENQQLQQNYTRKIELDLAERIELIQQQNHLLEEQRVQHLTREFEQRIAETEISALRSQMNPHFIFNCLNSIKLYTLENNAESASDYLTKFSLLIRCVLDNSRSEKISLENELDTLSLYAEMEAMRFKDKMKFILQVAPGIDLLFVEIPPLLLQPFVENAIWHGLMHKEEGGTVKVEVSQPTNKLLHIEITDNGIGRRKSAELKSKNATRSKSYGMKLTGERIELINQLYKINTKYQVIDLYNADGKESGTRVILEIPI